MATVAMALDGEPLYVRHVGLFSDGRLMVTVTISATLAVVAVVTLARGLRRGSRVA